MLPINMFWFGITVMLALVCAARALDNQYQPRWCVVVTCAMATAALAIILDYEAVAKLLQALGITVAVLLIAIEQRSKQKGRA
jgi:hypothetical protein